MPTWPLIYDAQVAAAARHAATGGLATARMRMIHATRSVTPEPVQQHSLDECHLRAELGGRRLGDPGRRAAPAVDHLRGHGRAFDDRRAAHADHQGGTGAFGGLGDEVLIINATTGLPVSSVSNPGASAGVEDYRVSRVTLANIEAGRF